MGCGCRGSGQQAKASHSPPGREPEPGDWVVEKASGERQVFTGPSARRKANYEAIISPGARAWKVED